MIRPLHFILNNKSLGDIVQPINGKVAELDDFARRKESQAAELATRSEAEFCAAQERYSNQQAEARTLRLQAGEATRLAAKINKSLN